MHVARSRTPSAEVESTLLAAADDLLEREGPDALSVRRIAASAGVAPMGVYNHFRSKAGIIEALFVLGFRRLGEAMEDLSEIDDPLEALWEGGARYRALALEHPEAYKLMFLRAVPGFEPSPDALLVCAEAFGGLVATVERAMRAGSIREADPALTAQVIWASFHGWVSLEICGIGFVDDADAGARMLERALIVGLAPER